MIQTWRKVVTEKSHPELGGGGKFTYTEVIDFVNRVVQTRVVGRCEDEGWIDQTGERAMAATCTPEGVASYRLRDGWHLVGAK